MPVLISDANILIDMQCGGVLDRMFRLDQEFAVLDILFSEELHGDHPELPGLGLQILSLRGEYVARGAELIDKYRRTGASSYDLLSLALAMQEKCPLLTGDRRLRELCEELGHETHGTLWLMNEMYRAGLLSRAEATAAYDAMRAQGRRLPWQEVSEQLRRMG